MASHALDVLLGVVVHEAGVVPFHLVPLLVGALWISYFRRSKRVKQTFVC